MNFHIQSGPLCRALKAAQTAQPTRNVLAVLSNVFIEAREDGVTFRATDLDQQFSLRVPADVREEGDACLLLGTLLDYASTFAPDDILSVEATSKGATVSIGKKNRTFTVGAPKDFPLLSAVEGEVAASVEASALRRSLDLVAGFTSREPSRPALCGVLVELEGERANLVGCDTYRFSRSVIAMPCQDKMSVILPNEAIAPIYALINLADRDGSVEMRIGNSASFSTGGSEFQTRLVAETYPPYRKFLVADTATFRGKVSVERSAFEMALKRVSSCADNEGADRDKIHWEFTPKEGEIMLSARSSGRGESISPLEAVFEEGAEDLQCAFNAHYAQSMLRATRDAKTLDLAYRNPLNGIQITSPELKDWLYMLQPMNP